MAPTQTPSLEPVGGWQQQLIDDYYNHRWQASLEPLCDWLQSWKNGELSHSEMEGVIEETHQKICELRSLFSQRADRLVLLVQWLDREWFDIWAKEHAPPPGTQLMPSPD